MDIQLNMLAGSNTLIEEEVFDRVQKAQGAFRSRGAIWINRRMPLNLKIRL
jgi:hypothetical protein